MDSNETTRLLSTSTILKYRANQSALYASGNNNKHVDNHSADDDNDGDCDEKDVDNSDDVGVRDSSKDASNVDDSSDENVRCCGNDDGENNGDDDDGGDGGDDVDVSLIGNLSSIRRTL